MAPGRAVLFSVASPDREDSLNEDAAMAFDLGGGRAVLAVADGVGGQRGGADASALALETLRESLAMADTEAPLRGAILNAFEKANRAVLELAVGAATTLAVVEIDHAKLRAYHVGDSEIWVVGQRGRLKVQTISHSPVGLRPRVRDLERERGPRPRVSSLGLERGGFRRHAHRDGERAQAGTSGYRAPRFRRAL